MKNGRKKEVDIFRKGNFDSAALTEKMMKNEDMSWCGVCGIYERVQKMKRLGML